MFSLIAGSGIGHSASRDLAFGLGPVSVTIIEPPVVIPAFGGGYAGGGSHYSFHISDNEYSKRKDDDAEIAEILSILFNILE